MQDFDDYLDASVYNGNGINDFQTPLEDIIFPYASLQTIGGAYEIPVVNEAATDPYTQPHNLQMAIQLIREAVKGENEDKMFYEYLIANAPDDGDKKIIEGIRDDELGHYGLFRMIYRELTGQMLPPPENVPFDKPETYCQGLKDAIMGETNAVRKYRNILYAMINRRNINILTGIITDEIRHSVLYSYLYSKNNCKE